MTARLHADEPCWLVDNDPWESWHRNTEAEAVALADEELAERVAEDPDGKHRRAPVSREQWPCWLVACDRDGCDEVDEGDYEMGAVHYPGESPPVLVEGGEPGAWECHDHRPEPAWMAAVAEVAP